MPYDPFLKRQRALHVGDTAWEKFKEKCHDAGIPMQAVLNQFIDDVGEGHVELEPPKKVALRFIERKIDVNDRTDWR